MFNYGEKVYFLKKDAVESGRIYDEWKENGTSMYTVMEDAKPPVNGWQMIPGLYDLAETELFRTPKDALNHLTDLVNAGQA